MNDCEYYNKDTKLLESKAIRPDRQRPASQTVIIPWCSHEKSQVPKKIAHKVLGGGNLLKCEGDRHKCQIPEYRLNEG